MTPLHPEDHAWLCRVAWRSWTNGKTLGGLDPLAHQTTSGWEPLAPDDAETTFPDKGSIFWYDIPSDVSEGRVVLVWVRRQGDYESGKDAYQVDSWDDPCCTVDLRSLGDDRSRRLAATREGLSVAYALPRAYLRVGDDEAIGPVALTRRSDGRYILGEDHVDDLQIVELKDEHVGLVRLGTHQVRVVFDDAALRPTSRRAYWASDQAVAEGVLNRLLKFDRKAAEGLKVSKAVFKQYVASYSGFGYDSDLQRRQEAARFERVLDLVQVVEEDEQLILNAAQALVQSEMIGAQLDDAKKAVVEEAKANAAAEAAESVEEMRRAAQADMERERAVFDAQVSAQHADLASLREALEPLQALRTSLQAEISALEETRDDVQRNVDAQVASAEAALDARLAALAARPAEAFAELAILRSLSGVTLAPQAHAAPGANNGAAAAPTAVRDQGEADLPVVDALKSVGGKVTQGAGAEDMFAGAALLAGFATGRAVVVAGDGAAGLLQTFSEVVTGGRATWIPVSPSLSDPADLLTRVDPTTGRAWPSTGGLLEAVERAGDGRLALVVLDGFDRAPAEHYLTTLVACYADAAYERPRTLPYLGLDGVPNSLTWPTNLLLACIPSGGPSALPAGPAFWKQAVLVDAGDDAVAFGENLSELAPQAWEDAVNAADAAKPISDPVLSGSAGLPPAAVRAATAFYGAAVACNVPGPAARRLACVAAVVPNAASAEAAVTAVHAETPPGGADPEARTLHLLTTALAQ